VADDRTTTAIPWRTSNHWLGFVLVSFFAIVLPAVGTIAFKLLAPDWSFPAEPLHSLVEASGGVIAVILAGLLRLGLSHRGRRHPDLWVGSALLGMGVLDLCHAGTAPGNTFVFLHSHATFIGGLIFAGTLLPRRLVENGRLDSLPFIVGVAAVVTCVWALLAPDGLPSMLVGGQFTPTARILNISGGLLFFAAAARFGFRFRATGSWEALLFSALCSLFGSAGVLFELSALWDGPWWWWHCLRLSAYSVAIVYLLVDYSAGLHRVSALASDLDVANRELEDRVSDRTQKLVSTNEHLRTEMAERERLERARWEARLQHAQKLESLGVLAGGIAHEFNNLLVGMLGNASLALQDVPEEHGAHTAIVQIQLASRRAAELTRQMLAYSGKGRFVVEPLDMSAVVREMIDLLEVSISKKASLTTELPDGLPLVQADAAQLRQVVMNLITNASDALEGEQGTIRVLTGAMHAEPEYIDSLDVGDDLQPGQFIFVEVSDTGCGMSEETRVRMFDPFFTTKATGRGLGLAATLGILRGHGGAIRVYSEEGQGTSIKLLLPAFANAEAPNRRTSGTISMAALRGTILVVDDQQLVRSMVRRTLERIGLQIIEAPDGRAALDIYEKEGARIDGVLMDLTMPQLSGEETYSALRRLDPEVRVLLMSGYNAQDTTNRFVDDGLVGFLQKPFSVSELVSNVATLLAEPRTG
jgi:signal transduction histidine kinase/ActR/RegA family two-component response regulator